jgi:phosphate starvation-inducible protein PhoH and related proteins
MSGTDPLLLGEPKKRGRKSKKQLEKELMKEYNYDIENDNDKYIFSQKSMYENLHHLSSIEKTKFENKFTKPKNGVQRDYHNLLSQKTKKIVVATGPAGTGKTLFATEIGIKNFLMGNVEKLIFTRPSVSVDEDLGYLPGTLEEKMAPWVRPIYDILYNFIHPKDVTALLEDKIIEISPLGFMRGRTFKNCWIIADEMQNSTVSQMKMLLTRLGESTRLVVTGDLDQHDRHDEINGLDDFLNKFKGKRSCSITSVEFDNDDIQREEVVKEVLEIYGGDIPPMYNDITDNSNIDKISDSV